MRKNRLIWLVLVSLSSVSLAFSGEPKEDFFEFTGPVSYLADPDVGQEPFFEKVSLPTKGQGWQDVVGVECVGRYVVFHAEGKSKRISQVHFRTSSEVEPTKVSFLGSSPGKFYMPCEGGPIQVYYKKWDTVSSFSLHIVAFGADPFTVSRVP